MFLIFCAYSLSIDITTEQYNVCIMYLPTLFEIGQNPTFFEWQIIVLRQYFVYSGTVKMSHIEILIKS